MSKEAYADSLDHWAKCFRDGTLDDSFANEIAYLLEDKAHDLRVEEPMGSTLPVINTEYAPTREEWAEICEGIWIGALEGGSNYWIDYIHTKGLDLKCGNTVVDKNFEIVIHIDGEEDEIPTYRKAFDVIVEGLNRLDPMRQQLAYTDLGQLDANDYDYIIQLGVFGKEVFC